MAGSVVVRFRHADLERPVLVVETQKADTVIRIRPWGDEHLTLHREADGGTLLTHRSSRKPPSVYDAQRVEAARRLGYKNPEWHGTYYQHRPLQAASSEEGYLLVGKRIDIAGASSRGRYDSLRSVLVLAPAREFMLEIRLTTPGQRLAIQEPRVETPFGDLYFRYSRRLP